MATDPTDPWGRRKKLNQGTQTEAAQHKDFCKTKLKDDPRKLKTLNSKALKILYSMSGSDHTHPDKLVRKAFKHYQQEYRKVMNVSGGEILGFIFKHGTNYYFTEIMDSTTGGFTGDPHFTNKKNGSEMIAYFHSHPVKGHSAYASFHFSSGDAKTALCSSKSLHIGYLRTADGDVRRLDRNNYHLTVIPYDANAAFKHYPGRSICPNKCPCLTPYSGFNGARLKKLNYDVRADLPHKKNKVMSDALIKSVQNRFIRLCLSPKK